MTTLKRVTITMSNKSMKSKNLRMTLLAMALFTFSSSALVAGQMINTGDGGQCLECHKPHTASWKKTKHFNSLGILKKGKKAAEILGDMGLSGSVTESESCAKCHFTVNHTKKPVAGISCESCHGGAEDWFEIHKLNKKDLASKMEGRLDSVKSDSAKEHLTAFLAKVSGEADGPGYRKILTETTAELGMIRPTDTYALISNCYECHTVPEPDLINNSKHKAGSSFEILKYLTGDILHHYKGSNNSDARNHVLDDAEKRKLYVAGQLLFLENALMAWEKDPSFESGEGSTKYFGKMASRVRKGIGELVELDEILGGKIAPVAEIAKVFKPYDGKNKDAKSKYEKWNVVKIEKSMIPDMKASLKKLNMEFIAHHSTSSDLSALDAVIGKIKAKKAYQ
jgi:hypothetical protein